MIDLNDIKRVYLIGIGGIGMSGLARYFYQKGMEVAGYDKTSTTLTQALEAEGIDVNYHDEVGQIPSTYRQNNGECLIIFTPAIPKHSEILNYFINKGFTLYKRSQVLGFLSANSFTIAIAGTHGKTTTSTLAAHLLKTGGIDCSAFLGGISSNYNTNLLIGQSNVMVVEADEYDRSFLTLHPNIAAVTSMDADHLDIYGAEEQMHESFKLFVSQIKDGGQLIYREGLPLDNGLTYGISRTSDAKALNVKIENGSFYFDFVNDKVQLPNLELGLPGQHNVENAVAAVQIALQMDIKPELIRKGLATFSGAKRRFEYQVKTPQHIYIDDYAHHPQELKACFLAVRSLYPNKKLTVIFQPHLFTRTRDFMDDFAEVLNTADELILLEIYPARELPIEGITSQTLCDKIANKSVQICGKDEALKLINKQKPDLLLTVGAGDIDTLVSPLKEMLTNA